jgi:prevent-host-death family protein
MKSISTSDEKDQLKSILQDAQQEPVLIRQQNRDIAVVLSIAEYERLRAANIEAFLSVRNQMADKAAANGLTEERLNELLAEDDA